MDVLTALFVVLASLTTVATLENRTRRLDRRLRHLESKLDLLLLQEGKADDDLVPAEVAALAREGEDILAIRKYREVTGSGILEAKQVVDRLREEPRP